MVIVVVFWMLLLKQYSLFLQCFSNGMVLVWVKFLNCSRMLGQWCLIVWMNRLMNFLYCVLFICLWCQFMYIGLLSRFGLLVLMFSIIGRVQVGLILLQVVYSDSLLIGMFILLMFWLLRLRICLLLVIIMIFMLFLVVLCRMLLICLWFGQEMNRLWWVWQIFENFWQVWLIVGVQMIGIIFFRCFLSRWKNRVLLLFWIECRKMWWFRLVLYRLYWLQVCLVCFSMVLMLCGSRFCRLKLMCFWVLNVLFLFSSGIFSSDGLVWGMYKGCLVVLVIFGFVFMGFIWVWGI